MPSYAEEQKLLADQAIQGYLQNPQPAPVDQQALGQAALAGMPPAPPPVDQQALGQAALGGAPSPGLSPADQQALGQAALAGYGGAPPPAQQWTDPSQPGPGAVTDEQMLAASAPPAAASPPDAAIAAVPPAARAGAVSPVDIEPPPAPPPETAQAPAAPAPEPPPTPSRPAARNFQEGLDNFVAESVEEGEAKKREAAAKYQGALATAGLTKEQAADVTERLKRHNAAIDEQIADIKKTKEAMQAANEKADASGSAAEQKETTRQRVGGMLMLLGGMLGDGLARLGGNNSTNYMQQMQAVLDKDVQLSLAKQRERYNNDKEAAKRAGDNYARAVDIFGKTPEADAFTQILTGQQYTAEMAAQTAQSQSEIVRAGGQALKEARDTDTAQKVVELIRARDVGLATARARAGADNRTYSAPELAEQQVAGVKLTQKQHAIANAYNDDLRAKHGVETKEGAAQAKLDAAAALERAEVIPGLVRRPNQTPLSSKEQGEIRDQYRSSLGVQFMANKVAGLWNTVMDESLATDVRNKARSEFMAQKQRMLSGDSVDTGQGTITANDAQRMGGAWPDLPANVTELPWHIQNVWKGEAPSAETYRAYGANAMAQTRSTIRDAYGLLPAEEGAQLWADWDAKQGAGQKPKGESAPKGETKPALPEGKIAVVRKDGKKGMVSKDDPGLKDGTYKALQ